MVGCVMYAKIQELKKKGFSKRKSAQELNLDKKTVSKYWDMTEEEYAEYLLDSRSRTKILDPYHDEIAAEMTEHPSITAAIIDDHLREKFAEFEPSYRSVRLYVAQMREELGIPKQVTIRQYCEVAELPLGFQAQVDMGQKIMVDPYGKKVKIFIFAMVMSASRMKFVCFRDKPFTADEFIAAHDEAFRYFGGRTTEIVYDQDRVMTISENSGDLLLTETFEDYVRYVGFSVHLCRGYDPESKGKVERVVGYVKNNFLNCRTYNGIASLNSDGLAWLDRTANNSMHNTTKMIPAQMFKEESKHLKAVPTLSEPKPPREAIIRTTNVVHYKQNRYQLPRGTYRPGRKAVITLENERIRFADKETGELLADHPLVTDKVGKLIELPKGPARNRGTVNDSLKRKVLQGFEACPAAAEFVQSIIEKYPRYNKEQLGILSKAQEIYTAEELTRAVDYCRERDLYSANDFRDTLVYLRSEQKQEPIKPVTLPVKYSIVRSPVRPLSTYTDIIGGGQV